MRFVSDRDSTLSRRLDDSAKRIRRRAYSRDAE
jgi:hypothetical protein